MAMDVLIGGTNLDAGSNVKTALSLNPTYIGGVRNFSENDPGLALSNVPQLLSPEVDLDYRLRTANDICLDEEAFTYTAQNFTKHAAYITTFVPSWTATGFNTNPTNITTASAAVCLKTYKTFSIYGTETLSLDLEGAFTATVVANNTIEFGWGLTANTTTYDVFDGAYIRANSVGVYGVIRNNNAADTVQSPAFLDTTGVTWIPVVGRKYQFILYLSTRIVEYWINDPVTNLIWLAATITTPPGYGMPTGSQGVNVFLRQVHGVSGPVTASGFTLSRYAVRRGGFNLGTTLNVQNARANDTILSVGTLTTTFNQTVTAGSIVPAAAAVPANATSLLASLGGKVNETLTLAAGTDGILMSYQNPALPTATGTTYAPNKRLRVDGITIASFVSTVCVNAAALAKTFYLAYGSTSLSLAGVAADTVVTKAYRRVMLPIIQSYPINAAAGTIPSISMSYFALQTPIFVNPGEYLTLVTQNNAAATSGAATHMIQFDYSWE